MGSRLTSLHESWVKEISSTYKDALICYTAVFLLYFSYIVGPVTGRLWYPIECSVFVTMIILTSVVGVYIKSIKLLRFWKAGLGVVKKMNILSFILFPLVYTGFALLVKFEFDFGMARNDQTELINGMESSEIPTTMGGEVKKVYYLPEFIMLEICFLFNALAIYLNDIFLLITLEHLVLEKMEDQLL